MKRAPPVLVTLVERETGFEPATFSLARRCSTPEPLPRDSMRLLASASVYYSIPPWLSSALATSADQRSDEVGEQRGDDGGEQRIEQAGKVHIGEAEVVRDEQRQDYVHDHGAD